MTTEDTAVTFDNVTATTYSYTASIPSITTESNFSAASDHPSEESQSSTIPHYVVTSTFSLTTAVDNTSTNDSKCLQILYEDVEQSK